MLQALPEKRVVWPFSGRAFRHQARTKVEQKRKRWSRLSTVFINDAAVMFRMKLGRSIRISITVRSWATTG
jgi:hypothetical protein